MSRNEHMYDHGNWYKQMVLLLFRLCTDILLILGAPSHACLRIEKQLRLQMKEYIMLHVSIKNLSRKMFAKCVGTNAGNIGYAGFVYILFPCSGATLGTMVRVKKSSSVLHVPGR